MIDQNGSPSCSIIEIPKPPMKTKKESIFLDESLEVRESKD